MRRMILILCLLVLAPLGLRAQNNPYSIDDECYRYFHLCETNLGQVDFKQYADSLLASAGRRHDDKALVLYYVEQLKNLTTLARSYSVINDVTDAPIIEAFHKLQDVSKDKGYMQYYYYAFELLQNHYYRHGQQVMAMEVLKNMQEDAIRNKNEYGQWYGSRQLTALYISLNDYVSAKKYILNSLRIYHESTDSTIRRQSISRIYCDLADTYPIGDDSVRVNIRLAMANRIQHLDTLRCNYHQAKWAALYRNTEEYMAHRDSCVNDPYLTTITESNFFTMTDAIISGHGGEFFDNIKRLPKFREIKYFANLYENWGYKDLAFSLEKVLVTLGETRLSKLTESRIQELDVIMGKNVLSADLDQKTAALQRTSLIVVGLVGLVLLVSLIFTMIIIHNLRKSKKIDAELIAELKDANERARAADGAKTRFVQNMSHEVRTPLNAVVGFSQLLSLPDGSFTPEEKDEFAGHILNNTKMLTMLLDDILNASAMDSGNYRIQIEEGECGFMCQAAISSAEHRLQPGVTMSYKPDFEGTYTFRTDPRRVQQIIINLLTNSCKHTTSGSIVLGCSLTENPGEVTFSVTDTGPGVPPEKAEDIFNRFTKLNNFVQGTGLGLSICRDIASRMGGRVYLDTTWTGGGARFVLVLPVTPPETSND